MQYFSVISLINGRSVRRNFAPIFSDFQFFSAIRALIVAPPSDSFENWILNTLENGFSSAENGVNPI